MGIIETLVAGLAVWRLTYMLQDEEGPFGVFSRLQAWAAKRPDTEGGINRGFFCFYCLSIWVSMVPALFLSNNLIEFIIYTLAFSALAVFINMLHGVLDHYQ